MRIGRLIKLIQEECEVEMSTIDCDISDEVFLHIAKMAHERDITFNQMVTIILEEQLEGIEEDCSHDNTVSTYLFGNVCKDCGQNHVITKEECE